MYEKLKIIEDLKKTKNAHKKKIQQFRVEKLKMAKQCRKLKWLIENESKADSVKL